MPSLAYEKEAGCLVAGVDEAGRGPIAGPVVAAAVILPVRGIPRGIDDSKAMTAAEREKVLAKIERSSIVGVGVASVHEIDQINILQASLLAMRRAVMAMPVCPRAILVDGNKLPYDLPCPRHHRRRRHFALGGGRQHRRQGGARPNYGCARPVLSRVRVGP